MIKKEIVERYFFISLGIFCFFFQACDKTYNTPKVIAEIPVTVEIERFDQKFVNVDTLGLRNLKQEYPFLFPNKFTDDFWLKKSKDTLHQELVEQVAKVFTDMKEIKKDLESFYKHLKYYYPAVKEPRIISLISDVDYKNNIILRKELLLISLDTYLGEQHYFYDDISKFIRDDFEPSQLVPNIATEYAKKIIERADNRTFLAQMVLFGKREFLLSKLLPTKSKNVLTGYDKRELDWLASNEAFIWRYFIEKDLLFSTDRDLLSRFVYPAPFSKFYLEIDQKAPDRVGQFIGYQIVLAFMENNNVPLHQMFKMDSKTIFESSKYKPKK